MKKTRMPQRLLALVLVLMMLISVLPVSAMAAELTPADAQTGLTATDVTNELTDSDRLSIFEENMDPSKVSKSDVPADDEMVRVIVQLDADSLLDARNRTNAGMSMLDFQQTAAAKAQLEEIADVQLSVMNAMESQNIPSSFTFSYTSVISGFAAQVPYGRIGDIKKLDGVVDVVLCQTYYTDSMGSATLGQALTAAEVAAYSNNTQYQGEGTLIGILDTGLDVNHEAFANAPAVQKLQKSSLSKLLYQISQGEDGKTKVTAYSYAALWYAQKHSSSSLELLTEDDLYKSAKVPFAFDYADADADVVPSADAVEKYGNDHGTHVAGIAAGKTVDADGNVTFAGQSPEAQLAIFKVFSDSTNGASTDTILAALNDALLLDVDVINMSLGSNGGFGREAEGDLTTKYYDLVKSAGILLNCSAGNSYSSSQGGAKGDFTSVSDPDTGIISSSSSYDAALSVASVNANETAAFVTAQGRVPYQDVSGHDFTALLLGNDSSKTYEYVMVPNTGDTADYQGLDVTGKIAVVMRGGLSFEQKQLNAASAGAAGCIIYNNRDGYLLNMSVDNYKIPTVCISLANGQMMEAAQEKTLTVSKTEKGSVAMSDFSSWGPLPSLSLKPEITAPGGSIYSSLPFAQYGYMSGTSMASPYLAGVAAAALEYVNTLMPSASDSDKQLLVNRLLMSTADILYDENGVAYSPRKQGSGMVNLAEAVTTPAYLYVRGQDKTKIELGDDADQLGVYKLSFVVKNLTGSALSYDVNTTVQTESTTTDGLYIAQKGYVLSADTSAIKVSGGALSGTTVTVPANGEATVTVTVRLSDADRAYLAKFPNGIYVEGFVELTNNDDPALSVPFLGFYGDWTKAPIFEDADIYNGLDEKMYATNVAGVYAMMYVVKLGMYPFVVPEGYDTPSTSADKICVDLGGGNGVSNLYYLQAGLLRAAKTTNVTITDSDTGEVYLNSDGLNVRKAMYNSSSAAVRPGYVGEIFPPLTGIHLIPNNTRMTYTAAAYVDGFDVQDNLKNTYSFNFTSDGEMPYIVDRENLQFRTGDDGRKYLDVTLADNFCLAGATLYSTQWKTNVNNGKKEMSIGSNYYDGIIPALKADGTSPRAYEEYTYTFDVTDFYQKLLQGTFYVVAYDYAMNQCAYRVTLPENAVTKITLDQTAVTLPQKGYVQLNATVTPDDATDQNLVWSSSDSSVAEVKNGIVAAKAPGTATITVKSSVWTDVKAQCQVTVTDEVGADVPMSEFLLNTSSVTMLAGTTYTNVRLYGYAPFYATDLNLEWTSSDESVVTVEPNGEGDELTQYAKLTALKPGTATVTAKAKNGTASYDLAVTVTEATGSGSFNIVGDTLVSYSGTESTVTIPDGVRVIGENAFKNNDYVLNVICPDSLEEIGYRAFYDCDNLQSVSLPETLKVINEGAFYYCENLKTLGHTDDGVLPKGLTSIGVKAFYFCEALEGDLVIPEGVTSLSAGIFYNAYTLTSITIPDTVTSMDANGDQFANCTAVTSVTLSKNLTELPKTAFFTCKSLKHLPDLSNVTSVGTSCFAGCAALEEMVIPESLTFIGANAFARSSLTEITVLGDPTGLDSAFYNSLNLTTFVAPKLTTIGKQMFQGCTALVNFIVPDNVTLIGERAFQGCTNLKTLTFPASYKAETLSFGLTPFVSCPAFEGYVIEDGASIVRTEDGTLLVQVADYADNTATYKINLNKEELSGPVSVTLDKQSIKMYKGGTAALNAEVSPFGVKPDGVTWKSSDETVATVNERGIITGVNKGTATITAASIKDPTATASCVVTVQTVDTTLVGALMDTNGDAQFYTWDMEHDTTWKKLVNFETTKSVSASTFDARTGDVYLQDGSFNINKMDLDTGKTLATYPGFEGEIPMWDMEYSLVYSTEAKPMLASVYYTYFLSPKPVDNLDLSAFDLGLYLWLFADASYFTAVTSLGANKIDTDKDGVKDTDTELFLALDDAGNIWTMNVYPSVDKETGKDTWGASFGILESNLANVGYAANPTDDGDLYDSLYATVEGQELVLYLANFTGDASHVYRILLNEDTGKWEAADIGNFGDGVWPATLVGTMYHANEDAAKAVNAAMSKTTVHTAQAVEMTPAQIQRYNGAETQAAKGSLNTAAPVAAVVNLPMGDAAENATASNVTVSADEKTVTVNVLAKDAATNGLFTVDYDAANLTLTNVAFNTQYSSYKDASGKVTLGYVDLNGVTAGSTVATLTFTVNDPTALDKINVTVTETERNDQTVNNAETLAADLHTETETVNAKAATCTEDGYTGDVVCKACGKVITKGEVIPALGHKIELVGAKAATCTEDGYTGDEVCTVCGEIVKKGEVIPAMGHKIKLVGAKEPTCTEDGYTGDEVCTICGEIVKKGEVIKATGHQYKDGKCTVCGAADPNYKPSVKTGDESNTALWVLVMASAAMLAAAVVVLPRKKHSR